MPYAIVPHYRSQHPQTEAAERLVARYRTEGVAYRALRDGQAIVIADYATCGACALACSRSAPSSKATI